MTGKRNSKVMSKRDLSLLVKKNNLADDATIAAMSKKQLVDLLGHRGEERQSRGLQVVKLSGAKLLPLAMCSMGNILYLFDGATNGIWKVELDAQADRYVGNTYLLVNLPQGCHSSALSCTVDHLYIACPTEKGGLFQFDFNTASLECLKGNDGNHTIVGVCANKHLVACSNKSTGQVHILDGRNLVILSGEKQNGDTLTSRDGFSSSATHAQPASMCVDDKTVFVCDEAAVSIRIITDVKPLLKYHLTIDKLYEAFSVHSDSRGYSANCSIPTVLNNLQEICDVYKDMLDGVRLAADSSLLKPNGPQGSLPFVTMEMFTALHQNTAELCKLIASLNDSYRIQMPSLLSVPCEHHFSNMRSRYQMPTLLQYCDLLNTVVAEDIKRLTVSSYKYFTGKKSYYHRPELQTVTQVRNVKTVNKKVQPLAEEDRQLMLNWRKDHCAGKLKNIG